jgi:60 kDa SS-A/Ro ribonucleoprotein
MMANKRLFTNSAVGVMPTNTLNLAGGTAYKLSDEAALAQYVVTSCFNKTFYASAEDQVAKIGTLAASCRSEFLAKAAIYGHEVAGMKDTPAYILAVLMARLDNDSTSRKLDVEGIRLFERAFARVITNMKMLMNFVQIVRSGVVGRKSFGGTAKRVIRNWLRSKTGNQLFTGSIGGSPSFADIIKMIRPCPETEEKRALYAYFIDKPYEMASLPSKVQAFEAFKQAKELGLKHEIPDVPFQMLSALNLSKEEWVQVILNMPWNATRMNLNTASRHGVFDVKGVTEKIAAKLADPEQVRKNNVFPYQLLAAYLNTEDVPSEVRNALQDALEVATENVPDFGTSVAVAIDTSGSMHSAITGTRKGSTSKVTCVQVAALFGATIARKNKDTLLLPFDTRVHDAKAINSRDSIMTNADKLRRYGGGGTDVASALRVLNGLVGNRPELVVIVSDNESWFNGRHYYRGTGTASEWAEYRRKTPKAKLVCIDINANESTQCEDQPGVMNIGGFSDKVWPAIKNFVDNNEGDFVSVINAIDI